MLTRFFQVHGVPAEGTNVPVPGAPGEPGADGKDALLDIAVNGQYIGPAQPVTNFIGNFRAVSNPETGTTDIIAPQAASESILLSALLADAQQQRLDVAKLYRFTNPGDENYIYNVWAVAVDILSSFCIRCTPENRDAVWGTFDYNTLTFNIPAESDPNPIFDCVLADLPQMGGADIRFQKPYARYQPADSGINGLILTQLPPIPKQREEPVLDQDGNETFDGDGNLITQTVNYLEWAYWLPALRKYDQDTDLHPVGEYAPNEGTFLSFINYAGQLSSDVYNSLVNQPVLRWINSLRTGLAALSTTPVAGVSEFSIPVYFFGGYKLNWFAKGAIRNVGAQSAQIQCQCVVFNGLTQQYGVSSAPVVFGPGEVLEFEMYPHLFSWKKGSTFGTVIPEGSKTNPASNTDGIFQAVIISMATGNTNTVLDFIDISFYELSTPPRNYNY